MQQYIHIHAFLYHGLKTTPVQSRNQLPRNKIVRKVCVLAVIENLDIQITLPNAKNPYIPLTVKTPFYVYLQQ
jgi:hypothetical protein